MLCFGRKLRAISFCRRATKTLVQAPLIALVPPWAVAQLGHMHAKQRKPHEADTCFTISPPETIVSHPSLLIH